MALSILIAGAIGYLLGAIPFGYLVARARGVNIFEVGSRSPGATNVRRTLGAGAGNLVFVLDALKGAIASGWPLIHSQLQARWSLALGGDLAANPAPCCVAGLVGALLGHSFSCFTGFRGGKGVATAAGGFVVLMPLVTVIAAVVWAIMFFATRYVSLASILAAVSLPVSAWALGRPDLFIGTAAFLAAFVLWRHRSNCQRLLNGTENRFDRKPRPNGPSA
ncbi:MAG: glycerol-3-phosphate 1-O-acyltransferase PlsY [Opitutales bacterium]